MRAILVDPYDRVVREIDVEPSQRELDKIVGGHALPHWIVPHCFGECEGWVDEKGLVDGRKMWHFAKVNIWGPMLIFGEHLSECGVDVGTVRALVTFTD